MANKVNASHILVSTEEEANEIYENLKDGYSFEALAKQKSKCPSGEKGGNLGTFGRGQMVREFEKVSFSLKKGEISKPFKTEFGWHIVKVIDVG